ncbi:hypothetical protein GCM10022225_12590 [Plantactinospora mayteni]|uniref:Carrier domain-containing protein n=1 Tax=Plantactinospora mayteni TaxID=566021 RepID=A0ABQ4EGZ3_9ACTN|nr:non-ribosomal peptide synthetase [Plantactinospora mayteni]GIG93988.1 hypothetical protein Pma05_05610 [Plantactinospora mayteni]
MTVARSPVRLTPAQQALLTRRLRGGGFPAVAPRPGPAALTPTPAEAPLSFAQERLWVHDRLYPDSVLYATGIALRVEAPLDPDLVAEAIRRLRARHEVLRTRFAERDGTVRQIVTDEDPPLRVNDLRGVPEDEAEARVQEVLRDDFSRGYDLSSGPMTRGRLIRLPGDRTVLSFATHHVAADAWSFEIARTELSDCYAALAAGRPYDPPPPDRQYRDVAVAERRAWPPERLRAVANDRADALRDAPARLDLPTGRPRANGRGSGDILVDGHLPAALVEPARALAAETRSTLLAPMLAAYTLVLHRFSGSDDLLVGMPTAGRTDPAVAGLIGFFSNNVIVRLRVEPGATVRDLVLAARRESLTALGHQDLPFDHLTDALRDGRPAGRLPFHASFSTFRTEPARETFAGHPASTVDVDVAHEPFDLALNIVDQGGTCTAIWSWDGTRFGPDAVARFAAAYRRALAVLADPDRPVADADLLDPAERERALYAWNDTATGDEPEFRVHALVEARAAADPDGVAVCWTGGALTYGGLDRRANRLARALVSRGAGPGTCVGVALPRGPERVVALLAVLKSGAAVLALDPFAPAERRAGQIADAGALLTLSTAADTETGPDVPDTPLDVALHPQSAAYLISTSGSTGVPKAVVNTHAGFSNEIRTAAGVIRLGPGDRVLHQAAGGFDLALEEVFLALTSGATVVPAPDGADPSGLLDTMATHRVTVADIVPSVLRALLDQADLSGCATLRTVVVGAEALPRELVRRCHSRLGVPLLNSYGPSEAAIAVTCHPIPTDSTIVRIGRPIANTTMYVLDARMRPVPPGAAGELYLGGVQLARGYHGRPGLTADRFVPDPYGPAGARLYRTGDLGRQHDDGTVEYIGRADDQIKIRGYRVEPGEVEAVLAGCPDVTGAAVVAVPRGGTHYLAGFLLGDADPDDVRAHCRGRLPGPMIPDRLIPVPAFPVTGNGKVDRAALRRRAAAAPERAVVAGRPPRDATEETLVRIWAAALGRETVGVHDDFFDLGGNSLLAIRVTTGAREIGYDLPPAALFENPTVAELAARLRSVSDRSASRTSLVTLRREGAGAPIVLVHPVGGSVFGYRELTGHLAGHPVHALASAPGPVPDVGGMADRYLAELIAFGPDAPGVLAGWSMGGVVALELARRMRERTGTTLPVVAIDSGLPDELGAPDGPYSTLQSFVYDLARLLGAEPPVLPPDADDQPVDEVLAGVLRDLPDIGLTTDVLAERWATFAGNDRALRAFRPRPHPGPVHLVVAGDHRPDLDRWRALSESLHVSRVGADHYDVVSGPGAELTARLIRAVAAGREP